MDLFSVQLTVLVCLLVGNIVFGSLSTLIIKITGCFGDAEDACFRKIKVAILMLYVGAGVFISNSFLELLPEANKEFANGEHHSHGHTSNSTKIATTEHSEHNHHHFPMPEFLILCGFFLAYVLQEAIFFLLTKLQKTSTDATDIRVRRFCTCAKRHTECSRTYKDARPDQTLFGREKNLTESGYITNPTNAATNIPQEPEIAVKSDLLRSSIHTQAVPNYGTVTNVPEPVIENPLPDLNPPVLLNDERRIVMEQNESRHQKRVLINSLLIASALALQYIFLGIDLGSRMEHFKRWSYLSMTCLQNMLLTFSFGSYLAGNMDQSCIILFIGLLSTASPVGLIAAMIKKEAVQEIPHLAKGTLLAVACGTLLYTTFYEMLRQKRLSAVGLTKFTAIIVGASVMALLQYTTLHL